MLEELQEFASALEESEELRRFYYGGQIPEREKRRAIDALTEGMNTSTSNFLKVLSDNGRETILDEVILRYETLVEEHLGRVDVEVTTAVDLSGETLERLRERLGAILDGREVVLETRVDPDILGGAVFRLGGDMMDGSIRGRLNTLREGMMQRGVV
ncbi:F0F1 ATP synthase subunit delta [soil metagenome]